eukprot:gene3975-5695_t
MNFSSVKYTPNEYNELLNRVKSAIDSYNIVKNNQQSSQLNYNTENDAISFVQKIDEITTNRSDFFDLINKKLSKIESMDRPVSNASLIEWFDSKKSALEQILVKIRSRIKNDVEFLKKLSQSTVEGIDCLEQLLNTNSNRVYTDSEKALLISKVRKSINDLKNAMPNKSNPVVISTQPIPIAPKTGYSVDQFYLILNYLSKIFNKIIHQMKNYLFGTQNQIESELKVFTDTLKIATDNIQLWMKKYSIDTSDDSSNNDKMITSGDDQINISSLSNYQKNSIELLLSLFSNYIGSASLKDIAPQKVQNDNQSFINNITKLYTIIIDMKSCEYEILENKNDLIIKENIFDILHIDYVIDTIELSNKINNDKDNNNSIYNNNNNMKNLNKISYKRLYNELEFLTTPYLDPEKYISKNRWQGIATLRNDN